MGRGKNAPKNLYMHKALSLIDAELELLNLKITHPEQFSLPVFTEFKSDLYVILNLKTWELLELLKLCLVYFFKARLPERMESPFQRLV